MSRCMRTTITLDDDTSRMLEELQRQGSMSFKDAVNDSLRAGLGVLLAKKEQRRQRYAIEPIAAAPRTSDLDNVAQVLSLAEGDQHP